MRSAPPVQARVPKSASQNEFLLIFILLFLCLTLFTFRLGTRDFWDPDEGLHASTSKDMVLSGDWIATTFNGEPFYDKPPLHNWLVALSFLIFGFTEFAARFPAALVGTGCVFVTYLFGRRMFGPPAGFLSGAILATSVEFLALSRSVVHDISLLLFVTLVLYLFYSGYSEPRHRKAYFLLFYCSAGLAVLAKGPIGVLLPAAIIGLFLVLKKELGFIKEMMIGWGSLVFLCVAAPWYVLIVLRDPDYAAYFFIYKNLMSFFSEKPRHTEPFYYYFPVFLGVFFPWCCFLPYALIRNVRGRLRDLDDRILFLLLWFGFVFVFFSVARTKLPTYILPLFPAVSLLVGMLWHELLIKPAKQLHRGFLFSYLPLVVAFSAGLIYILVYPPMELETESGVDLSIFNIFAVWMAGISFVGFFLLLRKNYKSFFASIVTLVVSTILAGIVLIAPSINQYRSARAIALEMDQILDAGDKIAFYRQIIPSALFYTGRLGIELDRPEDLINYFATDKQVYCIITRKRFKRLTQTPDVVVQIGNKLIISNKKSSNLF